MHLVLIRHSKTITNLHVSPLYWVLSDNGISKAQKLSQQPIFPRLDVIYSSLQNKALETAIILAKPYNTPIKTDNDLTELTSITNGFIKDYENTIKKLYEGKIQNINNGETIKQGLNRFNQAIQKIVANNKDKNYVGIVSHGNILSIFSAQFCNYTPYELHNIIKMPDYAILDYKSKRFTKFWQ